MCTWNSAEFKIRFSGCVVKCLSTLARSLTSLSCHVRRSQLWRSIYCWSSYSNKFCQWNQCTLYTSVGSPPSSPLSTSLVQSSHNIVCNSQSSLCYHFLNVKYSRRFLALPVSSCFTAPLLQCTIDGIPFRKHSVNSTMKERNSRTQMLEHKCWNKGHLSSCAPIPVMLTEHVEKCGVILKNAWKLTSDWLLFNLC